MRVNLRHEPRYTNTETYAITWQDDDGLTRSAEVAGINVTHSGIAFRCPVELRPGTTVFLQAAGGASGYAAVKHCTAGSTGYVIGVLLSEEARKSINRPIEDTPDYYEFLQISPKAEQATIQRVYRFLASRYHPDNPTTGDAEKFLLLKHAFEVLSDPDRRVAYDETRIDRDREPNPAFESIDYLDGIEGEVNRRLAVLSLLYSKRRTCPEEPRVPLADLEKRMGFPREYLDFATWYLRSKKYITKEDNSDFALTALGVDYVESNVTQIPILQKMLNGGSHSTKKAADEDNARKVEHRELFQLGPGGSDEATAEKKADAARQR